MVDASLASRPPPERLNIALATGHVALNLYQFLALPLLLLPPRAAVAGVQLAGAGMRIDSAKAASELGYGPSPLRESLAEAVAWLAQQGLVRRPLAAEGLALQDA